MGGRTEKQRKIAEIFDEYFKDGLSKETIGIIQGWIADGESAGEKDARLEYIWNKVVRYRHVPSHKAHVMYGRISRRLDFPYERRPKRTLFGNVAARAAAVMVPVLLAAGIYLISERYGKWNFAELTSQPGQLIEAVLPDGTAVWLNGGTTLAPNGRRNVMLDGEAYFKVVNSGGKPFAVSSGSIAVTVLGTEFSVNAGSMSELAEVTLFKGSVKVGVGSGGEFLLEPEQRFGYNSATGETGIVDAPLRMPEWMGRSMIFEREPLENILVSLEDIFGVRFECAGIDGGRLVTLKLRGSESLAETMFVLSQVCGDFSYEINDNEIMVLGL